MTEHRCGTCKHWTRSGESVAGTCGVLLSLGSSITIAERHTGCPAWNPHPPADEKIPNNLWCVFDTRGHLVGAYLSPEDAGKASGLGASIVGYAHDMDKRAYARGVADAKAAAESTALVFPYDSQYCQLGDAFATRADIVAAIAALQPPG